MILLSIQSKSCAQPKEALRFRQLQLSPKRKLIGLHYRLLDQVSTTLPLLHPQLHLSQLQILQVALQQAQNYRLGRNHIEKPKHRK